MDLSDMPDANGEMAAHKLSREIPDLARPKSEPGTREHADEVTAALGDFALWLHDQWPAAVDRLEAVEATVTRVDARTVDILDNVSQMRAYLKKIVDALGLDEKTTR